MLRIEKIDSSTIETVGAAGERLRWNVEVFNRTKLKDNVDIFAEINEYFAWIPETRRQRIWSTYCEIHEVMMTVNNQIMLQEKLIDLVYRLYQDMPLQDVEYWVKMHARIKYPENLRETHADDDMTPAKTYLRSDYAGLAVLCILFRPMVPIWGQYIFKILDEVGAEFKEFIAKKLLRRTGFLECEYVQRLEAYIEAQFDSDVDVAAAVIRGISSTQLPEWLLASTIIRRISVCEINNGSIISNVYGFVSMSLTDLDKKFGGVREKNETDDSGMMEEGSLLERIRVSQVLTAGDLAGMSAFTQDVVNAAASIDASIPTELTLMCLQSSTNIDMLHVGDQHIQLVQWVMANTMSPSAIPVLEPQALIRCIAVCQAALIHWGFLDLAVLITAIPRQHDIATLGSPETSSRITPGTFERLSELYPNLLPGEPNKRESNPAYASITQLTKEFRDYVWYNTTAIPIIESYCQGVRIDARGRIQLPSTLGEQIARLAIKINEI